MKIVLTGSIAYDYLMSFPGRFRDHLLPDELHHISVSFLVETLVRERGGVAANIAYNLALLGERPLLMGTVGQDFAEYRAWLEAHGVDTGGVREIPGVFTASFFANTDSENNQIGSFYTGAMAFSKGYRLADAFDFTPDLVAVSPSDPGAMTELTAECAARAIPCLYDPSQQVIWLDGATLRENADRCGLLIVNDYEWEMIAQKSGLTIPALIAAGKTVIITQGGAGSDIYTGDEHVHIPIFPPASIAGPTGVGDAYRAGLLKGIACGYDWALCGELGALAAAYALEHKGTQNHSYTRAEFVARFRTQFDDGGRLDAWLAE